MSARLEADLSQLAGEDQLTFLAEYGLTEPVRGRFLRGCMRAIGLISFLTAGEDESRAWPVRRETIAVDAAGVIHSDIARGFIRAETVAFEDLKSAGDYKAARRSRQGSSRRQGVRRQGRRHLQLPVQRVTAGDRFQVTGYSRQRQQQGQGLGNGKKRRFATWPTKGSTTKRRSRIFWRRKGVPYVPVTLAQRRAFQAAKIKSFDFVVWPSEGPNWLVDIKGRINRTGRLDNWVTKGDLDGLADWQAVFGDGYVGMLVFVFLVEKPADWGHGRRPRCTPTEAAVTRSGAFRWRSIGEWPRFVRPVGVPGRPSRMRFRTIAEPAGRWLVGETGQGRSTFVDGP